MILNSHTDIITTPSQPPPPPAIKNTKVILWLGLVVLFQTSSVISSIDYEFRATYEQDLLPKSLTEIFIRINRDLLDQEEFGILWFNLNAAMHAKRLCHEKFQMQRYKPVNKEICIVIGWVFFVLLLKLILRSNYK